MSCFFLPLLLWGGELWGELVSCCCGVSCCFSPFFFGGGVSGGVREISLKSWRFFLTNHIAPENRPSQKETINYSSPIHFHLAFAVSFRDCKYQTVMEYPKTFNGKYIDSIRGPHVPGIRYVRLLGGSSQLVSG